MKNNNMIDCNYEDPDWEFEDYLNEEEASENAFGREKIGEGLEEIETWNDSIIEGHFYSLQNLLREVNSHADHSILDVPLNRYVQTPIVGDLRAIELLEAIDGITINVFTDLRGNLYYTCYLSKKKKKAAYKELEKLISGIQNFLDKNGYTMSFLEEDFSNLENRNMELSKKIKELEKELYNNNKNKEKKLAINESLRKAEIQYRSIVNYLNSPTKEFFCLGPVLCTRAYGIYIITKSEVFYNDPYKDYDILVVLMKQYHTFLKVTEYNRDGSKPTNVPHFARQTIPGRTGWNHDYELLKCSNEHSINIPHRNSGYGVNPNVGSPAEFLDPNVIRSKFISYLEEIQGK